MKVRIEPGIARGCITAPPSKSYAHRLLLERGVGVYETLFRENGVLLQADGESICVSGDLIPGDYTLPGDVSSQFVTGLLFALPLLDGASTLRVLPPVESRPYIDITLYTLKNFGIQITEPEPNTFHIPGDQHYRSINAGAEGDWSNAAFLLALNQLGGGVSISGLNPDSIQGDRVCVELFRRLETPGAEIDISACPDLGPVLFAVAAARQGGYFTGTRRLRIKESSRASAMAEELAKLGAKLTVTENTVAVHPEPLHRPEHTLCGHNDHRIVMAMAVIASTVGARSVENQQHRLTASGLDIPVGMKNPTSGDISVMMNSITAAQSSHTFVYSGWEVHSKGNPLAHAILRGSVNKYGRTLPNYHYEDLKILWEAYQSSGLENPAVIIDTNHANSGKRWDEQARIAKEVLHSTRHAADIQGLVKGLMIESYLEDGCQKPDGGVYGMSITDACLGWKKTEKLIYELADLR